MLKVVSPYNQKLIKEIPLENADAVENALQTAQQLFSDKSSWLPAWKRIEILERVVTIMNLRLVELTELAAHEGGKPYIDSEIEVLRAINGVKIAIEQISQLSGEQIPMGQTKASVNRLAFTIREPIGIVVSISAFNHPLNLIIHQTVTAVAAGAPVIIKPALTTPLSCIEFMKILKEAKLPEGWCQCVICNNEDAEKLATDQRVNYLSFIGSAKVGWYLRSKLSTGTRCALEHGGVAPVIIEPDVNIGDILPSLLKGGFYHAGQVCVSVQKIMVHKDIIVELTNKFAALAKKLKIGNPLEKDTDIGPLIHPRELNRVDDWVTEAIEKGGKLLCGGKRLTASCYEPTIILNPPQDTKVSSEEIFGPVVCIYSYNDLDEAISIANTLPTAFQASIFTNNIDNAMTVVNSINASAIMINDHTAFRVDWMPFGGRDVSGIGVGGIPYTIKEMTREKLVVIKSNSL